MTKEELISFIRDKYTPSFDEVIMLLAEYIGDKDIINACSKYLEDNYE